MMIPVPSCELSRISATSLPIYRRVHVLDPRNISVHRKVQMHREGNKSSDIRSDGRGLLQSPCREVGGERRANTIARYRAITVSSSLQRLGFHINSCKSTTS